MTRSQEAMAWLKATTPVLTALAALVTAIAGLIAALR